ncbi:DUF6502 family protein [Curvibacter sp. HBC28]|uniref:DUF6502 family protein n=1 Tax=Curvibacter microcysteis TaxID=3026419 RepID=A0ABT5MH96_9BURK|nr:DUF6502 family protein [Curvibacter sp. HBC28]MDD0815966.1 DUF6502 family protein [Curvibacter sp. HBC28]
MPPAADVMQAVVRAWAPLLRLLVASGVDYPRLSAALKPLFIEQAQRELLRAGQKETDSALTLLSGVHRKDVRAWRLNGLGEARARELSPSAKVFARWLQEPGYSDGERPLGIPRFGPAPSFEALARLVTSDVHPFSVLTELIRLDLVRLELRHELEYVVPQQDGFIPKVGSQDAVDLFAANLADHLQAAVSNLLEGPQFLEQSVFAEGITQASADELGALARQLWARSRQELIAAATRLYEADQGRPEADQRMRLGAYFWSGDWQRPAEPEPESEFNQPSLGTSDHDNP